MPLTIQAAAGGGALGYGGEPNHVALAAIDVALWDLDARRRQVPLGVAMGGTARAVPVYGSGGFLLVEPLCEGWPEPSPAGTLEMRDAAGHGCRSRARRASATASTADGCASPSW